MMEIKTLDESPERGVLPKIAQLEKTALSLNDDYLLGFTYYYSSFAKYYYDENRSNFTKDLSKAVHHLMKAGNHEMLARVFNLVAIDAFSYGCYDVAYNYYIHSLHEAEATSSILFAGVIETNLSLIFLELRNHRMAKQYIRSAIRRLYDVRNSESVCFSMHAAYIDDAMISLEQGHIASARSALRHALKYVPSSPAPGEDLKISVAMIRLRLAFADGDTAQFTEIANDLVRYLKDETYPEGYTSDIRNLCTWLMAQKEYALVGRILDAVNEKILSCAMIHIVRMFINLKTTYYTACGNDAKLRSSLLEQQRLVLAQDVHLNRIHKYTLELVRIDSTIRREQQSLRAQHVSLQKKAYHDALTGIANRHMLNKILESSFERAYEKQTLLGIAILDVDYFKEYNDSFGHPAGDRCLVSIASEMEQLCADATTTKSSVFCARYGGDEFVMIYEGYTQDQIASHAARLNERIRSLALSHPKAATEEIVTVSQGLCISVPGRKNKAWDYLSQADVALYQVKINRGRRTRKKDGIMVSSLKDRTKNGRDKYGSL